MKEETRREIQPPRRTVAKATVEKATHPITALITALLTASGGGYAYLDYKDNKARDVLADVRSQQDADLQARAEMLLEVREEMMAEFAEIERRRLLGKRLSRIEEALDKLTRGSRTAAKRALAAPVRAQAATPVTQPSYNQTQVMERLNDRMGKIQKLKASMQ